MRTGERAIEQAVQLAERERDAGVIAARSAVTRLGSRYCEDCGGEIDAKRRAAAPFATRCIDCQSAAEQYLRQHKDMS